VGEAIMEAQQLFTETCQQMVRERIPNLFRLFLNPYVVQTCFCLQRYVSTTWPGQKPNGEPYQTFLANGFHEALSGAIKLARCCARASGKATAGLIIDPTDRLDSFVSATAHGKAVEFLPGLRVLRESVNSPADQVYGFVVFVSTDEGTDIAELRRLIAAQSALVIRCVDRASLTRYRANGGGTKDDPPPDIVVFDESFANREVPFGAFAAPKALFKHWNKPGKSTFHSTTFQPNTISTLHFMRCLRQADPLFYMEIAGELRHLVEDVEHLKRCYRLLYNPALARAVSLTGFAKSEVHTAGHFVVVNDRPVLDAVGGVACSVRGHNPPTYMEELTALANLDCESELATRLRALTGLEYMVPAVSGASAVENMLRLALVAQFPRQHVLALRGGFGGKTLLALTGTWNAGYKENIDPLYPHVSYVDPFAPDALAQIDAVFEKHAVGVVQMELIQGVGGVRRVPEAVARHLDARRARHDYLLLIDEVQTAVYRTGSFTVSGAMGIVPDLLVIGKAVSDMMFPFALTLYSAKVHAKLIVARSNLADTIRRQHHYPVGYQTALNVLRFAERTRLAEQVSAAGALFAERLREELAHCEAVRDVRVFGLLIGIELDASRRPQRWFTKRLFQMYLLAMLNHPRFPVLIGFCQCEPNVLKITPPLTIQPDEIRQVCSTIGETLRRPFLRVLASAVGRLLSPVRLWRKTNDATDISTHAANHR
jgi:acetylornithine/succinyldiaminopimelate/putrescine aminotransferase